MSGKIAFLFLIYDEIVFYNLWHSFFKDIDRSRYVIHIHYKTQKDIDWFEQFKLKETVPTKWGDISLIYASNLLLRVGLEDELVDRFVFLSGNCVPLRTFDYVDSFINPEMSYFAPYSTNNITNGYRDIRKSFGNYSVRKASQWAILNRKHVNMILNNMDNLKIFKNVFPPDEHVYITLLTHLLKKDPESSISEISKLMTTNVVWWKSRTKYPLRLTNGYDITKIPKNYHALSLEEINYLRGEPHVLFCRKILPGCTLSYHNKMVDRNMMTTIKTYNMNINNVKLLKNAMKACRKHGADGYQYKSGTAIVMAFKDRDKSLMDTDFDDYSSLIPFNKNYNGRFIGMHPTFVTVIPIERVLLKIVFGSNGPVVHQEPPKPTTESESKVYVTANFDPKPKSKLESRIKSRLEMRRASKIEYEQKKSHDDVYDEDIWTDNMMGDQSIVNDIIVPNTNCQDSGNGHVTFVHKQELDKRLKQNNDKVQAKNIKLALTLIKAIGSNRFR